MKDFKWHLVWTLPFKTRNVKLTAAFSSLFTSKARDLSFLRRSRWLRRSTWRRINARRPFRSFRRRRSIDKCKMVRKRFFHHLSVIIMLKKSLWQHQQMQNGKKNGFFVIYQSVLCWRKNYYVEENSLMVRKNVFSSLISLYHVEEISMANTDKYKMVRKTSFSSLISHYYV